jgi:GTPase SAR1 family protein
MTDNVRKLCQSKLDQSKRLPNISKTLPSSMIVCIGPTSCGKTNSVVEFISRKIERFYERIIFTGSSADEAYYQFLAERIDGLKLIDNVGELPNIDSYKDR